ncbi:hypothetical protein BGX31_007854 [Mortierella sp. GBA43]|nr:hypothetical protein BGX31_007854 [Mortierella sp. GBA43]
MMLSNLPAYTGIITRINPIKRVEAWVDDLEDLEVPEEELDFNQVRSILAKSSSSPETLDNWDTSSENSATRSDDLPNLETPSRVVSSHSDLLKPFTVRPQLPGNSGQGPETIETLDDDYDLPEDLESLRLRLQTRQQQQQQTRSNKDVASKSGSSPQWQDSGSEMDDFDFGTPVDNHSVSSSASFSRNSIEDDEDFLDGIIIPETMDTLKLVTNRAYRPETDPSIFGRESRFQEEPDDFWDDLEIDGDDAFHRKGRNRNIIVRAVPHGRERSGSRVQRQVVPLKDFYALPSKIPRLSRGAGDNARSTTPAPPSLSRTHSTHLELPLRGLNSKSSLPRLKRPSLVRRDGARSSLQLLVSDITMTSDETSGSQPPSPTSSRVVKRYSLGNKDDLPSFKTSTLAMRSVTFTDAEEVIQPEVVLSSQQKPSMSELPAPSSTGKPFPGLRTLVRKFDFSRPRFSRGLIPLFHPVAASEQASRPSESLKPTEPVSSVGSENNTKLGLPRPSYSRSSSFTELGSIVASTETTKENLSSLRAGLVVLGDNSEVPAADLGLLTPVASADKFTRRLILKRSPMHSTFGDGSELDRFDNLPTFGSQDMCEEDRLRAVQAAALIRKQPAERAAVWLRKPQSIANFKDFQKAEAKTTDSEGNSSSRIRKTKSIRRSLFDIFGQSTATEQPVKEKQEKKKSKTKSPTLIRDLTKSRVQRVSGMVYNPRDKIWDGNEFVLDEFEEEGTIAPPDLPSPLSGYSTSLHSPLLNTSRPALISNMNQSSQQRPQVSGKMIFDPVKMCWMVNPDYISRRRQRKQGDNNRQRSMDEAWGDEPDVFADLSEDEKSHDEDDKDSYRGEGTVGSNSLSRSRGHRLLSRPSFQRNASQELLADDIMTERARSRMSNETGDSRPGSMGPHSIIPKSSRKSLNGLGSCLYGFGGGGYSSRGEFEVGVEFDITDAFLEQCINIEAQHRKEAGKFFALPCTQVAPEVQPPKPSRLSKMASSKMLSLGRKSGKAKRDEHAEEESGQLMDKALEKRKSKDQLKKDKAEEKQMAKEEARKGKGKEKGKEEASTSGAADAKKTRGMSFPINPLRSWPPRNKAKSASLVAQLMEGDGTEVVERSMAENTIKPPPSIVKAKESDDSSDGSKAKSKSKSKTISKAGFFPFASTYSTSSAAPAAVTLAARGRGGSRDVSFHQLPQKHDSIKGTLSFAATLAVARRGTYDRRRIGDNTFDPLNLTRDADNGQAFSREKEDRAFGKDVEEDDDQERGYRVMSKARGRAPMRPRDELILEFERHAGRRFR